MPRDKRTANRCYGAKKRRPPTKKIQSATDSAEEPDSSMVRSDSRSEASEREDLTATQDPIPSPAGLGQVADDQPGKFTTSAIVFLSNLTLFQLKSNKYAFKQ